MGEDKEPKGFWRKIGRTMTALSTPSKPVADAPGFLQGIKAIVFASCELLIKLQLDVL